MDIYQQIWDADMSGNGIQPILQGKKGDEATGYVVVNEKSSKTREHKLFPKVVIPKHKEETYLLCKLLLDNYRLNKTEEERISFAEEQEIHDFLEAIVDTKPMKVVRNYLTKKSGQAYPSNRWYTTLKQLYFTPFSMGDAPAATGFEHIVVGEQKDDTVNGYHFWYKYHLDDSTEALMDNIDYLGTRSVKDDLTLPETSTVSFKWDALDHDKKVSTLLHKGAGSFFNGCSIEGLLAIGALRFSQHGPKEAVINGAKYNLKLFNYYRQIITYYPEFVEVVEPKPAVVSQPTVKSKSVVKEEAPKSRGLSSEPKTTSVKLKESSIKLIAALVNPTGADAGKETVTLLNKSNKAVDLKGWAIEYKKGHQSAINAVIPAGETKMIPLANDLSLQNTGGTLTLFDKEGNAMDTVSYSREDASKEGWTLVF